MRYASNYERQKPAQEAFDSYDFSDLTKDNAVIVERGIWQVAEQATHPDRTLMRTLKIEIEGRTYYRVFAVVFDPDSTIVQSCTFGDLLP